MASCRWKTSGRLDVVKKAKCPAPDSRWEVVWWKLSCRSPGDTRCRCGAGYCTVAGQGSSCSGSLVASQSVAVRCVQCSTINWVEKAQASRPARDQCLSIGSRALAGCFHLWGCVEFWGTSMHQPNIGRNFKRSFVLTISIDVRSRLPKRSKLDYGEQYRLQNIRCVQGTDFFNHRLFKQNSFISVCGIINYIRWRHPLMGIHIVTLNTTQETQELKDDSQCSLPSTKYQSLR